MQILKINSIKNPYDLNSIQQINTTTLKPAVIYNSEQSGLSPFVQSNKLLVSFGARPFSLETQKKVLLYAIEQLDKHIENKTALVQADKDSWLKRLEKIFKTELDLKILNSYHNHKWLGQRINHKEALRDTLKAILESTKYKPEVKKLNGHMITVHNPQVAQSLQSEYDMSSFSELFEMCQKRGVFDFKFNKEGFVITTDIAKTEEKAMAGNIWVTDSARCLDVLRDFDGEKYRTIITKLANFYANEAQEFEQVIKTPSYYASNQTQKKTTLWNGVRHAFSAKTLQGNKKFITIRTDSLGVYLQKVSDSVSNGTFTPENIPENLITSMVHIPLYLKAIKYPYCKTCGNWENNMFDKGLTSDTEIVMAGLKKLHKLMSSQDVNDKAIAKKLLDSYAKICDKLNLPQEDFSKLIQLLIRRGQERLRKNHSAESVSKISWQHRPMDAALVFLSHTSKLGRNHLQDVRENLDVLNSLRTNLGQNGLTRYTTDAYENMNYDLALNYANKFDFKTIKDRGFDTSIASLRHKAEWFMVSDVSRGYGVQLEKVAQKILKEQRKPTEKELELIKECLAGQTEYINRAFARITPEGAIKSNGKSCPAWKVPESYMAVTSLETTKTGKFKQTYIPGINTPLSWAQSSLFDAAKQYIQTLKLMESINKL